MFESIVSDCLRLEEEAPKNYWELQHKVPLLMRKLYHQYERGEVPLDETLSYDISIGNAQSRNPNHLLVVGKTGRQKTRMLKNIIKGLHTDGYNILVIEPKSVEIINARNEGKGTRMAMYEHNSSLPVVSYTPAAYYDYLKRIGDENVLKKTTFYSLDIKTLDYREIWMSFGCPSKGADIIVQCLKEGKNKIEQIKRVLIRAHIMSNTRTATLGALDNLEGMGVFSDKFPPLPLEEEWAKGNIVVINYHGRMGSYLNTDLGFLISMVKGIGQMETSKGLKSVTNKMIVFDDAFMYAGATAYAFARNDTNYAAIEMGNCQYNYRVFGIDTILVIQNLDSASVLPTLIEGREDVLVTKTGNSDLLKDLIPAQAYYLVTNQDASKGRVLYEDKKNYYFQWVYCKSDGTWFTGYPFDCTVGHT